MTVVFVEAKNCCTMSNAWAGALLWLRAQELSRHLSGSLGRMFSLSRLRTSQQNFPFTVHPGATNSLCTMPLMSNFSHTFDHGSGRRSSRTLFIINQHPSVLAALKPLVGLRLAYSIITKCFFKHSVCFRRHLAESEAEANPFLLHISHFSRSVWSQHSTNTRSQKCTGKTHTSSQQNTTWKNGSQRVELTTPSGTQLRYKQFSCGIPISGTFG